MREQLEKIRKIANGIRSSRERDSIDFERMTAPCGLPCFECNIFLALENEDLKKAIAELFHMQPKQVVCRGCRNEDGKCAHLPMECRLYPCAQEKGHHNCRECDEFPCDFLHPYCDNAFVWHNTKVFNLCLIKRMGLDDWAKDKALSVFETYSYGKWTL